MPTCQKQHVSIEIKSEKLANDVSEATKGSHPRNFRAALRLVKSFTFDKIRTETDANV